LYDADGSPLPTQTCALAHWSDGSVKWLLVDSLLTHITVGTAKFTLRTRHEDFGFLPRPLAVQEAGEGLVVATGVATFRLDRRRFCPLQSVRIGPERAALLCGMETGLTDSRGRVREALVDRVHCESSGPVRTTVQFSGHFAGLSSIRFRSRVCFFSGTGLVRIRFTLHNARRARHRGGLWDLGDPGSYLFRELTLGITSSDGHAWKAALKDQPDGRLQHAPDGKISIYQDSSGGEHWNSRNHVNREGRVPCRFCGYQITTPGGQQSGFRAQPVLVAATSAGSVSIAIPEFWQQFPKCLSGDGERLSIGLFPSQWDDLFELQGGEQKTHTIWLNFGINAQPLAKSLEWIHAPARVLPDPHWTTASGVIPHLAPACEDEEHHRSFLEQFIAGPKNVFSRREEIDEYGWRNYGDMYADHEELHYKGSQPLVSHYNNQFDVVQGAILQWLRSADPIWVDLLDPLARHVVDIDIYHTQDDRAAYNGGLFWMTDHYVDAATATHRTYSRSNQPARGVPYGGGPSCAHNFTTGLLYYYYLTGDCEAQRAVMELADWVIRMDDGQANVLGLLDPSATGKATLPGDPLYNAPERGAGNSINALLDAWLLSNQRAYLDKAEVLIRRVIHPEDSIKTNHLLRADKGWSYTICLTSLARYLTVKTEASEFDAMYAYARASLLHYAAWMVEHERPYLDNSDELEYPTETWAAQELRKANVFRLAASYAEPELRGLLLKKGAQFAARAWSDLLRFETRHCARPAAILLIEGARDAYFRRNAPRTCPPHAHDDDFGAPRVFLPQRARVCAQLKTPRGLARILARLLNPRTWRYTTLRR
jgi:hypothetical protein